MMTLKLVRSGLPLLASALFLAACGKQEAPPEPKRSVLTQIVGAAAENASATYAGEVRSRYETPLGFRIPGKVAARLVDVGARVKTGDVLMRLDPSDTSLTVAAPSSWRISSVSRWSIADTPSTSMTSALTGLYDSGNFAMNLYLI